MGYTKRSRVHSLQRYILAIAKSLTQNANGLLLRSMNKPGSGYTVFNVRKSITIKYITIYFITIYLYIYI